MIRGIIFDCFGVLYHGSLDHLRELAPADRVSEVTDLSHSYDYGFISQADYFKGVGLILGQSASEVEAICRRQHVRNEPLIAYAKSLRPRYKVGLLSNVGRGFIEELFTPRELHELFDAQVLSNEVGMAKPGSAIFELTAQRLGLDMSECVMIDDSARNTSGAEMVGMSGVLYESVTGLRDELRKLGVANA